MVTTSFAELRHLAAATVNIVREAPNEDVAILELLEVLIAVHGRAKWEVLDLVERKLLHASPEGEPHVETPTR